MDNAKPFRKRTRSRKISQVDGEEIVAYDRPHLCRIGNCGKSFTRREHLKRHQLNHSSARWSCTNCAACFTRKDLYQRHISVSADCTQTAHSNGTEQSEPSAEAIERPPQLLQPTSVDTNVTHQEADHVSTPRFVSPKDALPAFWTDDIDQWNFQVNNNQSAFLNDTDLDWFWQDSLVPLDLPSDQVVSPESLRSVPLSWTTFPQERDENGHYPPPRYLQESKSKLLVTKGGDVAAPNCGFPICSALTQDKRVELLMDLRDIMTIDVRDPIFSLNSMKQGIHLYSREIATEYCFIHRELFFIYDRDNIREAFLEVLGEQSGPELLWAIISFGWAFMRSHDHHETRVAGDIQRALRAKVLSHPRLASSPPLWLVQTLFLILLFARYQGGPEEYGAASLFHGVLLGAVLRLDRGSRSMQLQQSSEQSSAAREYANWVEAESVRRLIVQVFVMDVKNALLFGGEPLMSFRDMMDLRIPSDTDAAWYAQSMEEWHIMISARPDSLADHAAQSFVGLLKDLWQSRSTDGGSSMRSITLMYGILSIARELVRRDDTIVATTKPARTSALAITVERSLTIWEQSWLKAVHDTEIPWMLPTCTCLLTLARHTLFEVSPVDLQVVAGGHIIDGKRRGRADYANALRKVKAWARDDRGLKGLSGAAKIIQSRLRGDHVKKHCQHCLWCLVLAALICWNFEFVTNNTMSPADFIQDGKLRSLEAAQQQCQQYLEVATDSIRPVQPASTIPSTVGTLVMVTRYLQDCVDIGMLREGIDLLRRLTGIRE
jgi:hypothetical protein